MSRESRDSAAMSRLDGIEHDVRCAAAGDRDALDRVIRDIQGAVYNLALRMLWCPHDAADATQEVLIKVITHLSTYREQSAFRTWVYRITANHVLNMRRSRVEAENLTFDEFSTQLAEGLHDSVTSPVTPEQALLAEEVKIGCTLAMLICLNRDERIAYVLGEIFDLRGDDAGFVLEISPAAYRKRLSRARERLQAFMHGNCGLVNPDCACRCERRVAPAITKGVVNPEALLFAASSIPLRSNPILARSVEDMEELDHVATIFRGHPRFAPPDEILGNIRDALQGNDSPLFTEGPM
jgi:RNA polymerase sigma factor (sigma-70 family)